MNFILTSVELFAVPCAASAIPAAVIFRKRAEWRAWEWIPPCLAIASWIALVAVVPGGKSLSNLIEAPILGAIVGVLVTLRGWLAPRLGPRRAAYLCAAVVVAAGPLVWLLVPALPE